MLGFHPLDVFDARQGQALHLAELGMGMKVPDDLQAVKPRKDRFDLLMAPVLRYHPFRPSEGRLKTEGVFYDKPVFKLITKQKTETFLLIDLC